MLVDFNYPDINWLTMTYPSRLENFHHFIESLNLVQYIKFPTRNNATLDLLFASKGLNIIKVESIDPLGTSDHSAFQFWVKLKKENFEGKKISLYKSTDWNQFRQRLEGFKWNELLEQLDVENAWTKFKQVLVNIESELVPVKLLSVRPYKKWWSPELKILVRQKRLLWTQYKRNSSTDNFLAYKSFRNKVTAEIRRKIAQVEKDLSEVGNSKQLFQYSKTKQAKESELVELKVHNETVTTELDCANALNNYFVSVFNPSNSDGKYLKIRSSQIPLLHTLEITEKDVYNQLIKLNVNKASGPDKVSPHVFNP
jgi:hypothetical protein